MVSNKPVLTVGCVQGQYWPAAVIVAYAPTEDTSANEKDAFD